MYYYNRCVYNIASLKEKDEYHHEIVERINKEFAASEVRFRDEISVIKNNKVGSNIEAMGMNITVEVVDMNKNIFPHI